MKWRIYVHQIHVVTVHTVFKQTKRVTSASKIFVNQVLVKIMENASWLMMKTRHAHALKDGKENIVKVGVQLFCLI